MGLELQREVRLTYLSRLLASYMLRAMLRCVFWWFLATHFSLQFIVSFFLELNEVDWIHGLEEFIFYFLFLTVFLAASSDSSRVFQLSGPPVPQWGPSSPNTQCVLVRIKFSYCSSCEDGVSLTEEDGRSVGPGIFSVLTDYLKYISAHKIFSF